MMITRQHIDDFLSEYSETVFNNAIQLREIVLVNLPDIIEQIDLPAKMIAYCYGQKYAELICVIIPSKKGLKLGFNRGTELPDPKGLLKGTGKISRYTEIKSEADIHSPAVQALIKAGLALYKEQMSIKK